MVCFTLGEGLTLKLILPVDFVMKLRRLFSTWSRTAVFYNDRTNIFSDNLPNNSMNWKVADLLRFSEIPKISEAIEGDIVFYESLSNQSSNESYSIEPD